MHEFLIKIKAFFEGKGSIDDAAKGIQNLDESMQKAARTGGIWGGVIGGVVSTVTTKIVEMGTEALRGLGDLAKGFAENVLGASEFTHEMHDLGEQTGQTITDATVLGQAYKNARLGPEMMGMSINMLQKALTGVNEEGIPTKAIFDQLGLSINALKDMTPMQALQAITDKISALGTAADRTHAVTQLFGRAGGRLLPLLENPEAFETARIQVGGLGDELEKGEKDLSSFAEAWNSLDLKKQQFFVGVASGISGDLKKTADQINKVDLVNAGKETGYTMRGVGEVVAGMKPEAQNMPSPYNSLSKQAEGEPLFGGGYDEVGKAAADNERTLKALEELKKRQANQAYDAGDQADEQMSQEEAAAAAAKETAKARAEALAKQQADAEKEEKLKQSSLADQLADVAKQIAATKEWSLATERSDAEAESGQKKLNELYREQIELKVRIAEQNERERDHATKMAAEKADELAIEMARAAAKKGRDSSYIAARIDTTQKTLADNPLLDREHADPKQADARQSLHEQEEARLEKLQREQKTIDAESVRGKVNALKEADKLAEAQAKKRIAEFEALDARQTAAHTKRGGSDAVSYEREKKIAEFRKQVEDELAKKRLAIQDQIGSLENESDTARETRYAEADAARLERSRAVAGISRAEKTGDLTSTSVEQDQDGGRIFVPLAAKGQILDADVTRRKGYAEEHRDRLDDYLASQNLPNAQLPSLPSPASDPSRAVGSPGGGGGSDKAAEMVAQLREENQRMTAAIAAASAAISKLGDSDVAAVNALKVRIEAVAARVDAAARQV